MSHPKTLFIAVSMALLLCSIDTNAQSTDKRLQKSWIKISTENLSDQPVAPDTVYTRYTFDKNNVKIGLSPAWNGYSFPWSLEGRSLKIGFETYELEELTDSTLVFFKEHFRRIRLVSEAVYSSLVRPDTTERLGDQPVYVASNFLTPRYKKDKSFQMAVTEELEKHYAVRHRHTFIVTFVVTSRGKIERVNVEQGITAAFDKDAVSIIKNTSGSWQPAKLGDAAVNCEITFTLKYLDSIIPELSRLGGDGKIAL